MNVTLPNGAVITDVPDSATKDQVMQKAIAGGLATAEDFGLPAGLAGLGANLSQSRANDEAEEKGFLDRAKGVLDRAIDAVTGESRMTPAMENMQSVVSAPELNEFTWNAFRVALAQLFGSDASQEKILQSMGGKLSQDEKGNVIVSFPSGDYAMNKPGVSPQDVMSFAANVAALTPAGRAGSILGAAGGSAATDYALQKAVELTGGENVSTKQVGVSALLGAGGKALENAASAGVRLATGSMSPASRALIDSADRSGVPLMTSDIMEPTTWYGNALRGTGEKIPFAGTGGVRSDQQAARVRASEAFAEEYGVNRTFNPRDQEIYDSLVESRSEAKRQAGRVYGEIYKQMGDTPITLTRTLSTIDNQITQLSGSPNANQGTLSALQQFRDDLTTGPKNLQAVRDDRSNFRELMVGENKGNALTTRQDAVNRRVYSAMTADIREGVRSKAGDSAVNKLAEIDRIYAIEANAIKKSKLKNLFEKGDVSPDLVNGVLFSNKLSDVKGLYNQLTDAGRAHARTALINRAYNKALKEGDISVERFNNELQKLTPQTEIFFTGRDKVQLEGFKKLMSETRQAAKAPVTTPTGMTATQMGSTIGAAGGMFIDPASTMMVAIAAGGVGAGARIYEGASVRNALLRLANTPRGSTAFERRVNEAMSAIKLSAQAENASSQ